MEAGTSGTLFYIIVFFLAIIMYINYVYFKNNKETEFNLISKIMNLNITNPTLNTFAFWILMTLYCVLVVPIIYDFVLLIISVYKNNQINQ